MEYKTVNLQIRVPNGRYCLGRNKEKGYYYTCPNLTQFECGDVCMFSIGTLRKNRKGLILKPKECLELKEVN